jgi:hypothetical protein
MYTPRYGRCQWPAFTCQLSDSRLSPAAVSWAELSTPLCSSEVGLSSAGIFWTTD